MPTRRAEITMRRRPIVLIASLLALSNLSPFIYFQF
jgi:hypothetical protein